MLAGIAPPPPRTMTDPKSTHTNRGHLNHTLFWENLSPKNANGGAPPTGPLAGEIERTWGGYEPFKKAMNAALMGVQGSGWAWLVQDTETGGVGIVTRPVCVVPYISGELGKGG